MPLSLALTRPEALLPRFSHVVDDERIGKRVRGVADRHLALLHFLHFFDGFRTSHEIEKIDVGSDDDLRDYARPGAVFLLNSSQEQMIEKKVNF